MFVRIYQLTYNFDSLWNFLSEERCDWNVKQYNYKSSFALLKQIMSDD